MPRSLRQSGNRIDVLPPLQSRSVLSATDWGQRLAGADEGRAGRVAVAMEMRPLSSLRRERV
jgi:hypothetical protein